MGTTQFHHTGLLVEDLERTAEFYLRALDGFWLNRAATVAGEGAENVFPGTPGVSFRFCYIGFEGGGAVELMELSKDPRPAWATVPRQEMLPHFGLLVDDVAATAERVVEHGGKTLWPAPVDWGGAMVIYIADPDGNVIELFDQPLQKIVDLTNDLFPDARP